MRLQASATGHPATRSPSRDRRRAVAGVLASLLLHALLLTPILVGTEHGSPRPDRKGAASAGRDSGRDSTMTLVFIDESDPISGRNKRALDPASLVLAPRLMKVATPDLTRLSKSIRPRADAEDAERPRATAGDGDEASRALMFGRYVGQITARIERAWLRPRTALDAGSFNCRVEVLQDEAGRVQDIALGDCNSDARWQESVIRAIQSASPLPAPPEPTVFTRVLTLELDSKPFAPGGSTDGFEPPETLTAMTGVPVQPPALTGDVLEQLRAIRAGQPGTVDLRIEGSHSPETTAKGRKVTRQR